MRIGLLGSGVVGTALAEGWTRHGHETRVATRAEFADTADWCELAVLAVVGTAAEHVAGQVGDAMAGKVLVDATNPLRHTDAGPELFVGFDDSLGERVQRAAPRAHVVKAYNTVGHALMVDPQLPGGPPTMPIAGESAEAKGAVASLLEATGWEAIDLGGIEASRYLEPLCMTWVRYGMMTGTWGHAFKLLRP